MQQPYVYTFQCTDSFELLQPRNKRLKTERLNWTNLHLALILVYYFSLSVHVCIAAIMANVLPQNRNRFQLSSQAQQEATGVATSRQSEAFRTLVIEVQTSKEEAHRYREKSKYLELDVARTDAYLARTRQLLAQEQSKASQLEQELRRVEQELHCVVKQKGLASQKGHIASAKSHQLAAGSKVSFGGTSFVKETDKLKTGQGLQQEKKTSSESTDKPKADSILPLNQGGVSFEEHEIIIQQAMTLKDELTKLAKQKGQDVNKILEAAEYREQLKRLQQDVQDKADENDKLLERIYNLSRKDDGPASQVVELQFKNDKLEKRLRVSQVVIDTLSKRYDELKDEMEMSSLHQSKDEKQKEDVPEAMDTADSSKSNETNARQDDSTRPDEEDMADGTLDQQKQSYETKIQFLDSQLKQTMMENTQLYRERQEAERQRLIFEQRYNKLMETLQDVQQKPQQCSSCRSLQNELEKLRREFGDLKDMNELVRAQMKLYEEELRQEQQESASMKIKHNFHIEQWKKNCQRMGQQVDLLTGDLIRERDEKRKLEQLLKNSQTPRHRSLAPSFSTPARCSPAAPKSSPWQAGYRDSPFMQTEVECDGPSGEDHHDGIESTTLTPEGTDAAFRNTCLHSTLASHLMSVKPLECPRCKREYPPDRMTDFEQHVDKCIDSS